jgi:predicted oxidoreductase
MNERGLYGFVDPKTVEYYVAELIQIDRGPGYYNDDQLRRITVYELPRRRSAPAASEIVDPKAMPLIAIREFILARKSLGGIQTDLQGRVLKTDGTPIEGLRAVGESAGFGGGGIHGLGSLEGTFLGACVLTGRVTAKAIAGTNVRSA